MIVSICVRLCRRPSCSIAFGVALATYSVQGQELRAPTTDLSIPASLAGIVSGVVGVDQSEQLMQPAIAGATSIGLKADARRSASLHERGIVAYPQDLGVRRADQTPRGLQGLMGREAFPRLGGPPDGVGRRVGQRARGRRGRAAGVR